MPREPLSSEITIGTQIHQFVYLGTGHKAKIYHIPKLVRLADKQWDSEWNVIFFPSLDLTELLSAIKNRIPKTALIYNMISAISHNFSSYP